MRNLIIALAVFALLLSACSPADSAIPIQDGAVYATQIGTTIWGMQRAIAEKTGTLILMRDNSVLFMYNIKEMWGFVGVNSDSLQAIKSAEDIFGSGGNVTNAKSMAELVDHLKGKGWHIAGAKDVPVAVTTAVEAAAATLSGVASSWTTFIVVPAGLLIDQATLDGVLKGEIY